VRLAASVAQELERLTGRPAKIHPLQPLSSGLRGSNISQTFSVEVTTPPLPLNLTAVHMWERKMLSLEYRRPGSRFLGWTTQDLPDVSARQLRLVAEEPSVDVRAPSQRDLVAESVLRRPRASLPRSLRGRSEIRSVR
jgi:hypothetical protein